MPQQTRTQHSEDLQELLYRASAQRQEEEEEYEDSYDEDFDDLEETTLEQYADEESEDEEPEDSYSKTTAEALGLSQEEQQNVVEAWETFRKHYTHERAFFFFFCLIVVVALSSWGTIYKEQLHVISKREVKLKDLRNKSLITTAELVGLERINNIEQNIQTYGLDLEHSTQPPYKLIDKSQTNN